MNTDLTTALRRAIAARQEHQEAAREWVERPSFRTWLASLLAERKRIAADEEHTKAWCRHVGIDPDDIDDVELFEATSRLVGETLQ